MSTAAVVGVAVVAVAALLIVAVIAIYNGLVRSRMRTREAWSGIDVQLKRRADLVPNLIDAVREYAAHEQRVFDEVTHAHAAVYQAAGAGEAAGANVDLTRALGRLFAIAEAYPALRASENYRALQEELADAEEKIAYARQFYNRNTMDYNVRIETFPSALVAGGFGFRPFEFFEAEQEAHALPRIRPVPLAAEERSA